MTNFVMSLILTVLFIVWGSFTVYFFNRKSYRTDLWKATFVVTNAVAITIVLRLLEEWFK